MRKASFFGDILEGDVQNYIRTLRQAGIPVSSLLVQAAAEGIATAKDRTLLVENGSLTRARTASINQNQRSKHS